MSANKLDILIFSSVNYWSNPDELQSFYLGLQDVLVEVIECDKENLKFSLINSIEEIPTKSEDFAYFLPLSGGVQPCMLKAAENYSYIGLINGYLLDFLPDEFSKKILLLNGHPSCTDFYSYQNQANKNIFWLSSVAKLQSIYKAWNGADALKSAKILKVGETEPWVINSCRDPKAYKSKLGTTVISVAQQDIYDLVNSIDEERVKDIAEDFINKSSELSGVNNTDVLEAAKVVIAMTDLLEKHGAEGLSIACFAMIGALKTTSCLALSYLNDSMKFIGACEGDLEAAMTLYLLKKIGCDFVWVSNPVIYDDNYMDLAHCTAPRCMGKQELDYTLLPHHESGAGVATQVELPGNRDVTLVRIGGNLDRITCFKGKSESIAKQNTCHTQLRVHIDSTDKFIDSMVGTHQVLCYGDEALTIEYAAAFLGLKYIK